MRLFALVLFLLPAVASAQTASPSRLDIGAQPPAGWQNGDWTINDFGMTLPISLTATAAPCIVLIEPSGSTSGRLIGQFSVTDDTAKTTVMNVSPGDPVAPGCITVPAGHTVTVAGR